MMILSMPLLMMMKIQFLFGSKVITDQFALDAGQERTNYYDVSRLVRDY